MSQHYSIAVNELIERSVALENGPAQVALLEEAVRLADTHQDLDLGFMARDQLIHAGTFSGEPDKAMVAFSWCLAQADRDPERFSEMNLLWKYKWVLPALASFPPISKQQIHDTLADMTQRYQRAGSTMQPIHLMHFELAVEMGDKRTARHHYKLWKKTARDWLSNCPACEQDQEVWYQRFVGNDEKALEAAQPILNGQMRCHSVPHRTFGKVLLPLLRLGRLEEAARHHRHGYRMVSRNPAYLLRLAEHMEFLALTDNLARAVKLLEKHLSWALATRSLDQRFRFYLAGLFLLERLQKWGKTSLKLRLPGNFPAVVKDGHYDLALLHGWFAEECHDIADRFDRRNENEHFAGLIRNLRKLHKLATAFPLT